MTVTDDTETTTFAGLYRGIVRRVNDPQRKNRLVAVVPAINGDGELDWALPCFPFVTKRPAIADSAGTAVLAEDITLRLPNPGDAVWIMFEHGDIDFPVWLGTWLP